jgi:hypothetical protein
MKMYFEERPYSGDFFRPRPEIHFDNSSGLLIVATSWGAREAGRKVIEHMLDYLKLVDDDVEATSPFERLDCLSGTANNLRIATLLANEALYREDNQTEYKAGVELFACSFFENEMAWLQLGHPQVLFCKGQGFPCCVGGSTDLAFEMSSHVTPLPPLPNSLLGLSASLNLSIGQQRINSSDKLVLMSHSALPAEIYQLPTSQITLDALISQVSKPNRNEAFWLGLLETRS